MSQPTIDPSLQARFSQARTLIQSKQYGEARRILQTIEHPKAQEWLQKLDALEAREKHADPFADIPHTPPSESPAAAPKQQERAAQRSSSKKSVTLLQGTIAVAIFVFTALVVFLLRSVPLTYEAEGVRMTVFEPWEESPSYYVVDDCLGGIGICFMGARRSVESIMQTADETWYAAQIVLVRLIDVPLEGGARAMADEWVEFVEDWGDRKVGAFERVIDGETAFGAMFETTPQEDSYPSTYEHHIIVQHGGEMYLIVLAMLDEGAYERYGAEAYRIIDALKFTF